jgi:hypothetical protein
VQGGKDSALNVVVDVSLGKAGRLSTKHSRT